MFHTSRFASQLQILDDEFHTNHLFCPEYCRLISLALEKWYELSYFKKIYCYFKVLFFDDKNNLFVKNWNIIVWKYDAKTVSMTIIKLMLIWSKIAVLQGPLSSEAGMKEQAFCSRTFKNRTRRTRTLKILDFKNKNRTRTKKVFLL